MSGLKSKPSLFYIPAGISFADSLAAGLLKDSTPENLPLTTVLLPTRRAIRTLREAFLRQTNGKPLLLPQLRALGDIDAEELALAGSESIDLPPALSSLRRQVLLARTISKLPDFSKGPQQDMALATALGRLMDQIYTEDLSLSDLPNLVDRDKFAAHWQVTIDFLSILSEFWPEVLAENGVIDAADRRNRLLKTLTAHWKKNPPTHPVIAAGSTGSIPATAELLSVISTLPCGSVVLPGLDPDIDDESWKNLAESHPQATLRQLLSRLKVERTDVQLWPYIIKIRPEENSRRFLVRELMRPAETSDKWQNLTPDKSLRHALGNSLQGVRLYSCATVQEEAMVIATALRETLEEPTKTAALVTPDRALARRVAAICRRWNIALDDSAGVPLGDTETGRFLRLVLSAASNRLKPVSLLALLKHHLCLPEHKKAGVLQSIDARLTRGPAPAGIPGLKSRIKDLKHPIDPAVSEFLNELEAIFAPLMAVKGEAPFSSWLNLHIELAESLCPPERLWKGEDGEAASAFLAEFSEQADLIPDLTLDDYAAITTSLVDTITIRPRYGTHPRLAVLGQLEARLYQADRMILAGLNEGTWPEGPGPDPWMSRPMRRDFGLPSPERGIGLSAHDFVQGFCAGEVILTRSRRVDGSPAVPARWISRLQTVLSALDITLPEGPHLSWARAVDETLEIKACERPAPRPPVAARPRQLSVTQIDTWLRDPYSIYAKHILKLKKLDPLEQEADAAIKGTLLHDMLDQFGRKYPDVVPAGAEKDFLMIAQNELQNYGDDPSVWSFWQPRLSRIASWLVNEEQGWRTKWQIGKSEAEGKMTLDDFTLTARADRIDVSRDGRAAAIIDYKSGGTFSVKKMEGAELPQLPLEAVMVQQGAFEGIAALPVQSLSYWVVRGGREAGNVTSITDGQVTTSMEKARTGLENLIAAFDDETTPYHSLPRPDDAPKYNDYEHLARVKEWTALSEAEEAA